MTLQINARTATPAIEYRALSSANCTNYMRFCHSPYTKELWDFEIELQIISFQLLHTLTRLLDRLVKVVWGSKSSFIEDLNF